MIEKIEVEGEIFNCVHAQETLNDETGFSDCDYECVRWNHDKENFEYCSKLEIYRKLQPNAPSTDPKGKGGDSRSGESAEAEAEHEVEKCSDNYEAQILRFFIEHPIHWFTMGDITKYLNIDEGAGVYSSLCKLRAEKILNQYYNGEIGVSQWQLKNLKLCEKYLNGGVTLNGGN